MPEGIKAAESDISDFILNRRRALAHSVVGVATAGAATVGAVPIPIPDAAILAPLEGVEINSIARIYGIKEDDASKDLLNTIIEVGTVSIAAKAAINGLKAIPGINIGAAAINAIIAGGIVAAIGEGAIHIFEQIYKGEKSIEDIEWVKKFMEEKLSKDFIEKVTNIIKDIAKSGNKNMSKIIPEMMEKAFNTNNK